MWGNNSISLCTESVALRMSLICRKTYIVFLSGAKSGISASIQIKIIKSEIVHLRKSLSYTT